MIFIDPTQGLKKTCKLVVEGVPSVRSGPSLGKCWAKIRLTSTFDLRLLALWGVMNIINGIARGVSPCVRAPPSLAAEERMLWERSTYESGVR